jgi:hypothetical protein
VVGECSNVRLSMIDNRVAYSVFIGYSACNDALGCRVPASDGTYAVTLDDATRRYLDWCASQGIPRLHEMSPSEARAFEAGFRHLYGPGPAMYRELEATVEADGRTIALRCLIPKDDPDAVVVYYHGGGWVVGDIDDYTTFGRRARQLPIGPGASLPSSTRRRLVRPLLGG